MNWNDLTKQNKLLIYMYSRKNEYFIVRNCISDIVAYGISNNKNALINLLSVLRTKGFVRSERLRDGNGTVGYYLTNDGFVEAKFLLSSFSGIDVPDFLHQEQPNKTEDIYEIDLKGLTELFAGIATRQPKQNADIDETEIDALYEQIAELRHAVQVKEEQIANIKNAHSQTCALLDKKTKQVEYYENVLSSIEKTFADAAKWCQQIKQNAPC